MLIKCITIPELNISVQTKIHDKGKRLDDIKIPEGWRLLRADEIILLFNNYEKELNMARTWEFIEQPFRKFKNQYFAWFVAGSDGAYLVCGGGRANSDSSLGVRFCRDLK